jgi:hypothetical protein
MPFPLSQTPLELVADGQSAAIDISGDGQVFFGFDISAVGPDSLGNRPTLGVALQGPDGAWYTLWRAQASAGAQWWQLHEIPSGFTQAVVLWTVPAGASITMGYWAGTPAGTACTPQTVTSPLLTFDAPGSSAPIVIDGDLPAEIWFGASPSDPEDPPWVNLEGEGPDGNWYQLMAGLVAFNDPNGCRLYRAPGPFPPFANLRVSWPLVVAPTTFDYWLTLT